MEVIKDMDNRLFTQLVLGMNRRYRITFTTGEIISPSIEAEMKRRYGVTAGEVEAEMKRRGFSVLIIEDLNNKPETNESFVLIDESMSVSRLSKLIKKHIL